MKELWTEKYRPKTVDEYVFKDITLKEQIEQWIADKTIPHLLFSGNAGTGKTTLAKVLLNEIGVEDTDILFANGSKEGRKIEWIDKLIGFCQTMPFGEYKVVLVDEADYMNKESVQPALRNLMEEYSSFVRFILTCNYPNKIIAPLKSRCQEVRIDKSDLTEFTARIATILMSENIEFDLDTLDTFVRGTYPDLRKCINNVQMNSVTGKLIMPDTVDSSTDYRVAMIDLFKSGKFGEARKLLCSQARPEEMEDIYRWMYDNIALFGKDEEAQDNAVLIIKQALVDHNSVADPEINLSAALIRLTRNL